MKEGKKKNNRYLAFEFMSKSHLCLNQNSITAFLS